MNESIIDRTYVCLKLIDMLYKKGLVNEATYLNVNDNHAMDTSDGIAGTAECC